MISVTQGFGNGDLLAGTDAAEIAPVQAPTYAPSRGGGGGSSWLPPPRVVLRPEPRSRPRPRRREDLPPRYIAVPPPPPPSPRPAPLAGPSPEVRNPWLRAALAVDRAGNITDALPALRDIATTVVGQRLARRLLTDLVNKVTTNPKTKRKK